MKLECAIIVQFFERLEVFAYDSVKKQEELTERIKREVKLCYQSTDIHVCVWEFRAPPIPSLLSSWIPNMNDSSGNFVDNSSHEINASSTRFLLGGVVIGS